MPMTPRASPSRRRFRPSLWPTLGLLLLVAATVALGNWQRQRAYDKQTLRDRYEAGSRAPPLAIDATLLISDPAGLRFREVRAEGVYDATHQLLIDNKVHAGHAGFDVVAPLKLAQGEGYLLVDRGWVAQGASRAALPHVPPPSGVVVVDGRINLPPARYLELGADANAGPVRENLDIARIATGSGLPLLPFIVEQTKDAGDGLVRDWPAPDFGIEQHKSYMVQWYSLAGLGVVLWLALNWRMEKSDDVTPR